MSRRLLLGLAFLLAASATNGAGAETCSSSTLDSADFAVARWCGDPPGTGTLRMVRRGGRAEEFLNVPLDAYREVVRTPRVAQYVAEELAPLFERGAGVPEAARPAPVRAGKLPRLRDDRAAPAAPRRPELRHVATRTHAAPDTPAGPRAHRGHRRVRSVADEPLGAEAPPEGRRESRAARGKRARRLAERGEALPQ